MPKLKLVAMPLNSSSPTVVYATFGKEHHLLELSPDLQLRRIRTFSSTNSSQFWSAHLPNGQPCVVFWKGESCSVIPLEAGAKARTVKVKLNWRAQVVASQPGLYSVTSEPEPKVVKFDGQNWVEPGPDAPDGWALDGSLKGAFQRTLRPGPWQTLVAQAPGAVVTTKLATTTSGSHWFVATESGTFIGEVGAPNVNEVPKIGGWCAVGLSDRFLISRQNKVWSVDLAGNQVDEGIGCDEPHDLCLFGSADGAFYLTGSTVIYRHHASQWSRHDLAEAAKAINLA